jgi:outer membrane protein assembly factor BamB
MWRYDANRSGATPHGLPAKLYLQWSRDNAPLKAAWPDQDKMQFDIVREPIVVGQTIIVNSSRHDCIRALDTRTGVERWKFFADAPVRFAAVAWEDRIYFASDDGYLYCLNQDDGRLVWKFRGGPSDGKILGNDRLISMWPARGAPVIVDGKVYFAASIWPFMGIFIHALDARTGEVVWTNDGDGSLYMRQPHNADSFGSIAPQGPLVAIGGHLLLPGGRSVPACLDRKTGKLLSYKLAENGHRGGGSEVAAIDELFFNGGAVYDVASEEYLTDCDKQVVLTKDHVFTYGSGMCRVLNLENQQTQKGDYADGHGKKASVTRRTMPEIASTKVVGAQTLMKAGSRLYLGGLDRITVLEWNAEKRELTPSGSLDVEGHVVRLIAADDRLFAVTCEGRIYCFAGSEIMPAFHERTTLAIPTPATAVKAKAEQILAAANVREGYGVVWGVGDGKLVEALALQSDLHLIVVEPDVKKVNEFRERWAKADLYGTRIALLPGDPASVTLPPYLANVMVYEDLYSLGFDGDGPFLGQSYQSLRPFGGKMCIALSQRSPNLTSTIAAQRWPNAKVEVTQDLITIAREGALPGSANCTHENTDAANTRVSKDTLVRAPLGVLWFGGPSHDGILPRHGHGPQPQVIDGRMIIEGVDLLRAIDIYTGRLLWEAKLPGVGAFYNNLAHQPGANGASSNFVSASDGIYVAYDRVCVRLDPATGKKLSEFPLPKIGDMKEEPRWGYINVVGDYLIGGADPLLDAKLLENEAKPSSKQESSLAKLLKNLKGHGDDMSASRHLAVLNRHSGKVLWTASAKNSFRHNATCAGGGRLYTIDRLSGDQLAACQRDGKEFAPARLVAFDLKSGKEVWNAEKEIFGTWLSYSAKHDVIVEAGRVARDSMFDEPSGMRAYRAYDGVSLWFDKAHVGPAMIHGDTILQDRGGCDLLTGKLKMRPDPISGELVAWRWSRSYGCNTPTASEHLLTFRSGAAGYFDLCNDGGTGNFGGFRSSCTNNLIVAGGVLTAPEYTRTCTCAYQNQTSIGLVYMPDAEMWTSIGSQEIMGEVKRLGLNFGAPGSRKADDGTLWLEYPRGGAASPAVQVTTKPETPEVFRRHSSAVAGPYNWVASSGLKNISKITLALGKMKEPRTYTVRLYFAEPDKLPAGKRRFNVALQGKPMLTDFDIAAEANGPGRTLVKEFKGILAQGELTVSLTPSQQTEVRATVLCGLELIVDEKK